MIPSVGATEILILLAIVLLLFGAKRIPELAKSLGSGVREFKRGALGREEYAEAREREKHRDLPKVEKPEVDKSRADDASTEQRV